MERSGRVQCGRRGRTPRDAAPRSERRATLERGTLGKRVPRLGEPRLSCGWCFCVRKCVYRLFLLSSQYILGHRGT
ncbi:hypothetical protein NDU88_008313 [Pleurodeles waltl]|uniref:Uncharacterized protein n=1 Tax=Pleurodeles waltl TaxID=8319 RepID=A0AAV7VW39_PLEWA|nr:hypothetical protein NDU88_008313 [Pleurodeles waltl]